MSRKKTISIVGGCVILMVGFYAAITFGMRRLNLWGYAKFEVRVVDAAGKIGTLVLASKDSRGTEIIEKIPGRNFPEMEYLVLKVNDNGKKRMAETLVAKPDTRVVLTVLGKQFSQPTSLSDLMIGEDGLLIGAFKDKKTAENSKVFLDKMLGQ